MSRIGGSSRVRGDLAHALEVGRKVTAKVQWVSKTATKSRARWIHCTPLLGVNDTIGVWMVILVDDEDDGEEEREQISHEARSASRSGSNYTAEALPWDEERQRANPSGVSTSIWSDTTELKKSEETGRPKPRRPMFRQPSEMEGSIHEPFLTRPGPYSFTSNNDPRISVDETGQSSIGGADSRATSQDSTFLPLRSTMQPKVKIAGRPSFEGDSARKAPINMPGLAGAEREIGTGGRSSTRRTYKSLSPYGILFED